MIKILILEDTDFPVCSDALATTNIEVKRLNQQNITYDDIAILLDQYYESTDLIIVDLQIPDAEHNGLQAINIWRRKKGMEINQLNFGIIAITNHLEKQAKDALGNYPKLFGNSFLGLAPKDENLPTNLKRLITNAFITPPFVRAGDKYINTELLENEFEQFIGNVLIQGVDEFNFTDIVYIQKFRESNDIKICLNNGEVYEGKPIVVNHNIEGAQSFFNNFCFDLSCNEFRTDLEFNSENEFQTAWETYKQSDGWRRWKEDTTKTQIDKLILLMKEQFSKKLPVFVCLGNGLAVNILYLRGSAPFTIKENKITKEKKKSYAKFHRDTFEEIFEVLGHGRLFPNKQFKNRLENLLDSESTITSYISINNSEEDNIPRYLPIYGERNEFTLLENAVHNGNITIRIRDSFSQRVLVFDELCSDRWQSLLKQLAKYYNCY